jgi:hypothetical protein
MFIAVVLFFLGLLLFSAVMAFILGEYLE